MELLTSVNQYKNLVSLKKTPVTNCYILPDELEKLISKGSLFFEQDKDGNTYLYEKRNGFYRMYFFIKDTLSIKPKDVPVTCELISFANKDNADFQIKLLKSCGFYEYSSALRASLRLTDKPQSIALEGFMTDFAVHSDAAEILNLWEERFDIIKCNLPDIFKISDMIKEKRIICAYDDSKKIAGAVLLNPHSSNAEIKHIAVRPQLTGKGIGRLLESEAACIAYDLNIKTIYLWVLTGETGALEFHKKMGYKPDGRISRQFILNKEMFLHGQGI